MLRTFKAVIKLGDMYACMATRAAATRVAVEEMTAPVATADPEPTTPMPE